MSKRKINFEGFFKQIDGKESNVSIAETMGSILALGGSKDQQQSVKRTAQGVKIYNEKMLIVDSTKDLSELIDQVAESNLSNLCKSQLFDLIDDAEKIEDEDVHM